MTKTEDELAIPERSAQSVAEVRKELDESRQRLASSAEALRLDLREGVAELKAGARALKAKVDWKTWVADHPWGFVLGAVALGIFLGTRADHEHR